MNCCVCNKTCMHVGDCSFCNNHQPISIQYPIPEAYGFENKFLRGIGMETPRQITVEELAEALDRLGLKAVPK